MLDNAMVNLVKILYDGLGYII